MFATSQVEAAKTKHDWLMQSHPIGLGASLAAFGPNVVETSDYML
jgi:hypothetical protein